MTEISFTHDINIEKFKAHVNNHFTAKQLEDVIATLYMYIEIKWSEEMSKRIYAWIIQPLTESKLQGVNECINDLRVFLTQNTWQRK